MGGRRGSVCLAEGMCGGNEPLGLVGGDEALSGRCRNASLRCVRWVIECTHCEKETVGLRGGLDIPERMDERGGLMLCGWIPRGLR